MAQVTVNIDGKAYRMACEEGQEDHLLDLAARFDSYISNLRGSFGEIGDLRLTVMAGIMIMDELGRRKPGGRGRCAGRQAGEPRRADHDAVAQSLRRVEIGAWISMCRPLRSRMKISLCFPLPADDATLYIRVTVCASRQESTRIPGALLDPKGAVPDLARGLGYMAPTYFCRRPGSNRFHRLPWTALLTGGELSWPFSQNPNCAARA